MRYIKPGVRGLIEERATEGPWFVSPAHKDEWDNDYYTIGDFPVAHKPYPSHVEGTFVTTQTGNGHDGKANGELVIRAPLYKRQRDRLLSYWKNLNEYILHLRAGQVAIKSALKLAVKELDPEKHKDTLEAIKLLTKDH